jgi:hypothetical protein
MLEFSKDNTKRIRQIIRPDIHLNLYEKTLLERTGRNMRRIKRTINTGTVTDGIVSPERPARIPIIKGTTSLKKG